MGSYTAPASPVYIEKVTIDNTMLQDQVVIGPVRLVNPWCFSQSSPLNDGGVSVVYESSNGFDQPFANMSGADKWVFGVGGLFGAQVGQLVKPVNLQVMVDPPPTVGIIIVYLSGIKTPANPLF